MCAECGNTLRGHNSHRIKRRYYRDTAREKGGQCAQRTLNDADPIEAEIGAYLARLRLPADWRAQVLALVGAADDSAQREQERRALMAQLERTRRLFQLGDIDEAHYMGERAKLQERIDALRPVRHNDLEQAAVLLQNFAAIWDGATLAEREEQAHGLLRRVYVKGGKIVAIEPKPEYHALLSVADDNQDADGGVWCVG